MSGDFASYLGTGESVKWTGRPQQGLALRAADLFLIPFSLLWCGFAIFWEVGVWRSGAPSFLMLWGGAFVLAGLYFVIGRFFWDAFVRSKIKYALTDRRALILGGVWGHDLTEVDLRTTSEIRYKDIDGSRGTISFGPEASPWRAGAWHSTSRGAPEFFRAENASSAYRLIQAARAARS
jgi:hypothetical protein